MNSEEHPFDLLPAYALGSLDDEETLQVSEHLSSCKICRAELMAFDRVVNDLPLAIEESAPPNELKSRIMAHTLKKNEIRFPEGEKSLWDRLRESIRSSAPVWGPVGVVLILILGLSNLILWGRLNQIENVTQNVLLSIPMQGTESTPQAVGMLVVSRDGEHGTLIVDGLPALDDISQYQLWLIRDGQRTSGGLFSVDDEGYGSLWVSSPEPLLNFQAFGVTVEPAGGSSAPTGEKVLGGELQE